jgi:phosphatidate phosphatase PAH1
MEVGQDLQCVFANGELRPSDKEVEELASVMKQGPNSLRFQLQGDRALYDVNAAAFLWSSADKAIVCDIDGTLTRSDIIGYSAHVLGYEYMHEGVSLQFRV